MSWGATARQPLVSTVVTLRGPLTAAAITAACDDVDGLLRDGGHVVVAVSGCDLSVVDAVSRMRLLARRCRGQLEVVGADVRLFTACGLGDVLSRDHPGI
jgi:hypothetical protein